MQNLTLTIPGPRPSAAPHRLRCPPLGCDTNAHIFGPHRKFALDPGRRYTPPETTITTYLDMLHALASSGPFWSSPNFCRRDFGNLKIRRTFAIVEEPDTEAGRLADNALRKVTVVAVLGNPYIGRYVEDLWCARGPANPRARK